jgi:hypothetical protein
MFEHDISHNARPPGNMKRYEGSTTTKVLLYCSTRSRLYYSRKMKSRHCLNFRVTTKTMNYFGMKLFTVLQLLAQLCSVLLAKPAGLLPGFLLPTDRQVDRAAYCL